MKYVVALILIVVAGVGFLSNRNHSETNSVSENSPTLRATVADDVLHNEQRQQILVELFTSEGCSSCPPADQTLRLLVKEQPIKDAEIIALSEHVDYWNRLGWTDPFSSAQFSERQNEYSNFFGKNGEVYTPQMIVDGTREFVGSNMREAQKAIGAAANAQKAAINLIARREKDQAAFEIKVTDLPNDFDSAIVLLAIAEDNLTSNVARGENGGQKLSHVAVARSLTNVGVVTGGQQNYSVAPTIKLGKSWKKDDLNAIAFVQDLKSKRVFAIAKTSLR